MAQQTEIRRPVTSTTIEAVGGDRGAADLGRGPSGPGRDRAPGGRVMDAESLRVIEKLLREISTTAHVMIILTGLQIGALAMILARVW